MKRKSPLLLLAILAAGCSPSIPETSGRIRIEKRDPEGQCFVPCGDQTLDPAEADVGGRCPETTPTPACGFAGGADTARVVVDLDDLVLDPKQSVSPALTLLFEDGSQSVSSPFVGPTPGSVEGVYHLSLTVPPRPAAALTFRVGFGTPDFGVDSAAYSVGDAPVTLTVAGCEEGQCTRAAGVGKAMITVAVPKALEAASATLVQSVDGAPLDDVTVLLDRTEGNMKSGTHPVLVPIRQDPLDPPVWRLFALAGGFASPHVDIQLVPPDLEVEIVQCPPAQCALPAGDEVTLVVSAPRDILPAAATVTWTLDGLVTGDQLPVELDEIEQDERMGAVRRGYRKISVPDAPGKTWQLRARINESLEKSQEIQIGTGTSP